jgi:hypothetical protein
MPVMTDQNRSVAANTTVDNVLSGKLEEFLRAPSTITLHAIAQAVGVRVSLIVGGEAALDDQEINARAGATNTIVPDDYVVATAGYAGDRLILRIRNTTGAAIIVNTRLETNPT